MGTENETATEKSMQDIADTLESRLYGEAEVEPEASAEEEEVLEDGESLPEDDDSDSDEEEEGSDDLEDIAEYEDEQSLAAYLGVEEDRIKVSEDGAVALEAIVDGERKDVPLTELVSSYQLQSHVNNKSMALETERKEFEEVRGATYTELKQRVDGLDALGKVLEESLVDEYNAIDWEKLRVENPSEWTALRQEYAEKAQKIQRSQALIKEESERQMGEVMTSQQAAMKKYLKEQMDRTIEANPTWTDEKVRKQDVEGIKSFLLDTYGFQDDDLSVINDSRAISLIQDAMKFRSGQKGIEEKKQKKVPKFRKPGAAKANSSQLAKARDVKSKRSALKNTGKVQDAANLLLDRM